MNHLDDCPQIVIAIAGNEFYIHVDYEICDYGIKIIDFTVDGETPDNATWDFFLPYVEDRIMKLEKLTPLNFKPYPDGYGFF